MLKRCLLLYPHISMLASKETHEMSEAELDEYITQIAKVGISEKHFPHPNYNIEYLRRERGGFAEGKSDDELLQIQADIKNLAALIADMLIEKDRNKAGSL